LVTNVPIDITAEKLRGFVSDHWGQITSVERNHVEIYIQSGKFGSARRKSDRFTPLVIQLQFSREETMQESTRKRPTPAFAASSDSARPSHTHIQVLIKPKRRRERRHFAIVEQARRVMASLQSYLMASDAIRSTADLPAPGAPAKKPILMASWLKPN
jgi:hypothetical protein